MPSVKKRLLTFAAVTLVATATTFSFAIFHTEDGTDTVAFLLTDQYGNRTTHEDLSAKPLLVFFGFTSCDDICPIGLHTLSKVMNELQLTNQNDDITPVMITVDPRRDSTEILRKYLAGFGDSFVGLTGSRVALENVAAEFNTFLDAPPKHIKKHSSNESHQHTPSSTDPAISVQNEHTAHLSGEHGDSEFIENYQLTHSSVVYLVDTYSRVVDYISLDEDVATIADKLRKHLSAQG